MLEAWLADSGLRRHIVSSQRLNGVRSIRYLWEAALTVPKSPDHVTLAHKIAREAGSYSTRGGSDHDGRPGPTLC
jgi:hypothetical protein